MERAMSIPAGTRVLFEKAAPEGPYYPYVTVEGTVMDPEVLKKADQFVQRQVRAPFNLDGSLKDGYALVNSGIYEIPKFAMDVYAVLISNFIY